MSVCFEICNEMEGGNKEKQSSQKKLQKILKQFIRHIITAYYHNVLSQRISTTYNNDI